MIDVRAILLILCLVPTEAFAQAMSGCIAPFAQQSCCDAVRFYELSHRNGDLYFSQDFMSNSQARCSPLRNECANCAAESGFEPCQDPCVHTTKLPGRNESGGTLDEIPFPVPILQKKGNEIVVDGFEVTVRKVPDPQSEYVLVTGVVKTAPSNLKSEVELQVDVLTQPYEVIRIQRQPIPNINVDGAGTLKIFVKLVRTTTKEVIAEQDSPEWRISDLKTRGADSKMNYQVVIRLPY